MAGPNGEVPTCLNHDLLRKPESMRSAVARRRTCQRPFAAPPSACATNCCAVNGSLLRVAFPARSGATRKYRRRRDCRPGLQSCVLPRIASPCSLCTNTCSRAYGSSMAAYHGVNGLSRRRRRSKHLRGECKRDCVVCGASAVGRQKVLGVPK